MERWRARRLVVPKNQIDQLLPQLHGATVAPFRTVKRKSIPHVGFLLVTRPARIACADAILIEMSSG